MPATTIDPTAARALHTTGGALFLDVRTPGEFETAHIDGAVNLPLDRIGPHLGRIAEAAGAELVLVCQSGARAEQCRTALAGAGLTGARVLSGGMAAWTAGDGPVLRGTERWAMERQVRLVAGGIVLASVLASIAWEPAKYVAAAIGGGLAFAALSNSCAMAKVLSLLPYNRPAEAGDIDAAVNRITQPAG